MKKGLVSVILVMNNAENTIYNTITSVLDQSYRELELIVVDDASEDDSLEYVRRLMKRDGRIQLIAHTELKGYATSMNEAIRAANGQYLTFLRDCDTWKQEKLSIQLELMKKTGRAMSFTACNVVNASGQVTQIIRHVPLKTNYTKLLQGNCIHESTVLIDREQVNVPEYKDTPQAEYVFLLDTMKSKKGLRAMGIDLVLTSRLENKTTLEAGAEKTREMAAVGNAKMAELQLQWNILFYEQRLGMLKSSYYLASYIVKKMLYGKA